MTDRTFSPGITSLISTHAHWLKKRRIGLASHQAAVDAAGVSSVRHLSSLRGARLAALFGPEHGFRATAGAGVPVGREKHPDLGIPIYSLYGKHRRPTSAMLKGIDLIVIDFQDLGARMYTYLTTMLYVMQAAAEHGITVIIADRPIPLPCVVDGPMLEPSFHGFVAAAPLPMSYGMTPGETALWLKKNLGLDLDLRIAPMRGYGREGFRGAGWPEWIPPSPAIRTWESAQCYVATVFTEGLRHIDCGRSTQLAFRVLGASWMRSRPVLERLHKQRLPGVAFHAHRYEAADGLHRGKLMDGIRMTVCDPHRFQPARVSVAMIRSLQEIYGQRKLWCHPQNRLDGFDRLYGTQHVRERLVAGTRISTLAGEWRRGRAAFERSRQTCLLYA